MEIIVAENVKKDFEYYRKSIGLKGATRNLFRREKLIKHAVQDISFRIEKGEAVGLLGPNGAGKTTTLKMLSGILHPTSGNLCVAGFTPWERKNEYKRHFSIVMGQKNQLWWDLPAMDTFELNRRIYEVDEKQFQKIVGELSEVLDVKEFLDVQVRRLSLGERMKMEIIASLIHSPEILFLDEPTIGLDIISQKKIREFLKYYNEQTGTTMILTSHYTLDIEALCPRTIIINEGTVVYDGCLKDVSEVLGRVKLLSIKCTSDLEAAQLQKFGTVRSVEANTAVLEVEKTRINRCSQELLCELPVVDFNVEDIPVEEGIAYFYQR